MSIRLLCHELDADAGDLERQWAALRERVARARPHVLVLPEMPFAPWLASSIPVDPQAWAAAATEHDRWLDHLDDLDAEVVVTTRPIVDDAGVRANEAVVVVRGRGIVARRRKTFLPDEPGFHEATWYDRGPVDFPVVDTPVAPLGVMVCTELWFPEHGRALGAAGARIIAVPRATPVTSVERWEAGARVLATVAGAYVLSVNRAGGRGVATFDGGSVLVDPEGRVLARTTPEVPVAAAEADLAAADRARATYPRYVDASHR